MAESSTVTAPSTKRRARSKAISPTRRAPKLSAATLSISTSTGRPAASAAAL